MTLGEEFGARPGFRIALMSSPAFDPSIEQAALPLVHGASIVVVDDETRESPHELWTLLREQKVDLLNCTPSFFELILADAPQRTSLKHLALGGESFASDLYRQITRSIDVGHISNLYGPTETTIDAVQAMISSRQAVLDAAQIPIGRPLPGYRVYVLDGFLEALPVGVGVSFTLRGWVLRGVIWGVLG